MNESEIIAILAERANRSLDHAFNEEMKSVIKYWRSQIIRQTLNSNPTDRQFFKTFPICIEMEKVTSSQFLSKKNCKSVFKSKLIIPSPLRIGSISYDYIGSKDFSNPYTEIEAYNLEYHLLNRFIGKKEKYFRKDGYLYAINSSDKELGIDFIPDSLDELRQFKSINGKDCYDPAINKYPMPLDSIQKMIQAILSTELRIPIFNEPITEIKINENEN